MVRRIGDDLEGPARDPSGDNYLARKAYVDTQVADATKITSGKLGTARMPRVISTVRTLSIASGALDIDASVDGNNVEVSVASNFTQNVPTNGVAGQVIQVACYAAAAYVVTFNASFGRLTGIASTLSIPAGKNARYALRATAASGTLKWLVESVGVEQ